MLNYVGFGGPPCFFNIYLFMTTHLSDTILETPTNFSTHLMDGSAQSLANVNMQKRAYVHTTRGATCKNQGGSPFLTTQLNREAGE